MYNEIDYYSDHNQQQDLFRNKNFNSKKVRIRLISHLKKNRVSDPHTDMGITGI